MLLGVVPFGLVAGAAPVSAGYGLAEVVGLSTLLFAGASQLALVDVLDGGGSALLAAFTALTINLRLLLYSASIAPWLHEVPIARRLAGAYLLTDQAYAVSVDRFTRQPDAPHRFEFYLGAGFLLWSSWQVTTLVGGLVGARLPDDTPLDFAVPLVFLGLLVPSLTSRPALVAAAVGGTATVAMAELGAGSLSLLAGAIVGIVAGALAEGRAAS